MGRYSNEFTLLTKYGLVRCVSDGEPTDEYMDYVEKKMGYAAAYYEKSNIQKPVIALFHGIFHCDHSEEITKFEKKERAATAQRVRVARLKQAGGKLSKGLRERLYIQQDGKCACCGDALGKTFHLDHIMPVALGGSNTDENMQLLLPRCNLQKWAYHPVDFMQCRGVCTE